MRNFESKEGLNKGNKSFEKTIKLHADKKKGVGKQPQGRDESHRGNRNSMETCGTP